MTVDAAPATTLRPGMGSAGFIGLIASLMAVNALAIDSMLPALPTIMRGLGLPSGNAQQWIVTAYLLGFGTSQIIYGTLADRYGRKPVLLAGLAIYVLCSIAAAATTSLPFLLTVRAMQGVGAAATRVLAVSIVRDCYSGAQMARVMSISFIVFLAVPILAPSLGQLIMLVAPWRWIFGALALFGTTVMLCVVFRLPETLHPEDRIPISVGRVLAAYRTALTNRVAVGYMMAMAMMLGGLFGFINSAQQVFGQVFNAPGLFTTVFALVAMFMALSSLLNARIVGRLGTRVVSHAALLGYIAVALVHAVVALAGFETLWTFTVLQGAMMFGFGLVVSNFGSLAMGPLGHLAGTASSIQGFVTTLGGTLVGFAIGQSFNGSTVPLTLGFAATGTIALMFVLFAEHGRLFQGSPAMASSNGGAQ